MMLVFFLCIYALSILVVLLVLFIMGCVGLLIAQEPVDVSCNIVIILFNIHQGILFDYVYTGAILEQMEYNSIGYSKVDYVLNYYYICNTGNVDYCCVAVFSVYPPEYAACFTKDRKSVV